MGGILNPNPFMLFVIGFMLILGLKALLKEANLIFLKKWVYTYLIFFAFITIMLCINLFIQLRTDSAVSLKGFYMVVKFFYTFMQPAAIVCIFGFGKLKLLRNKKFGAFVYTSLILYHLLFGLGYVGFSISRGSVLPSEFYLEVSDFRNAVGESSLGVEFCLLEKTVAKTPFVYSSLIDLPSQINETELIMERLYKLFRTEDGRNYNITPGVDSSKDFTLYSCDSIKLVKN